MLLQVIGVFPASFNVLASEICYDSEDAGLLSHSEPDSTLQKEAAAEVAYIAVYLRTYGN
ncbi:hypothetical protein F4825DRAFT_401718 [Nemania diffusa]|nr:hypothetical protein F4825DRAFT_401718 [Nemania diffusa]